MTGKRFFLLLAFIAAIAFGVYACTTDDSGDADNGTDDPGNGFTTDEGTPLNTGDAGWEDPPMTPPGEGDSTQGEGSDGRDDDGSWSGGGNGDPSTDEGEPGHYADGDASMGEHEEAAGCDSDADCPAGYICDEYGNCVEGCQEVECEEQAWCDPDNAVMSVCSVVTDPETGCESLQIEEVVCPEGTECVEPDGDVDCYEIETPQERPMSCPDEREPVVLYMSNDDSNSQASPIIVRQKIMGSANDEYGYGYGGYDSIVWPQEVRIHEFLNYYDIAYDNPSDKPLQVGIQMRRVNDETGEFSLLLFAQGRKITEENRRPINIVFSLDTSGSMSGRPIQMLKAVVRNIAAVLQEGDIISAVEWSDHQDVLLESYAVQQPNDPVILDLADRLESGGSTDLHGGLVRAYELARENYSPDRINRVIIISDGGANTGVTDIELISNEADDSNDEGIYMVGVGTSEAASYYRDDLMNSLTDAGKGAYIYIDTEEEAQKMFGDSERFLANVEVAARDVRMELTLPWYFSMKEFHGEEYSEVKEEVEPQHLSPNDAMSYHQIVQACEPHRVMAEHSVKARAEYKDPITRAEKADEITLSLESVVTNDASELRKADAIVHYAKALIVIGYLWQNGEHEGAIETAGGMADWLRDAALELNDDELEEIADLMERYHQKLEAMNNDDTTGEPDDGEWWD